MAQKKLVNQQLALYDHAKITFLHPVINIQWHAKFGLPFSDTHCTLSYYTLSQHLRFQNISVCLICT